MEILRYLDLFIIGLGKLALIISGLALIALLFIGSADRIGTEFFGLAIPSAIEIQEALEASMIFLALATVQHKRAHIVIDVVTSMLQGTLKRAFDIISTTATALFFVLLTWQAFNLSERSVRTLEKSSGFLDFPVYPFKVLFAVGCAAALLETLRQLVRLIFIGPLEVEAYPAEIAAKEGTF